MFATPKITKKQANSLLSKGGGVFPLKFKKKRVFPERVEMVYLPFYLFHVTVEEGGKGQKVALCVDGLLGHSVFFVNQQMDLEEEKDQTHCGFALTSDQAKKAVLDEYKKLLLEQGLRTRRELVIGQISHEKKIFYPFWIGYLKKTKGYDFKALDAVSGEIQGIKMRKVFFRAFHQLS
jgi:hypothetical protein